MNAAHATDLELPGVALLKAVSDGVLAILGAQFHARTGLLSFAVGDSKLHPLSTHDIPQMRTIRLWYSVR